MRQTITTGVIATLLLRQPQPLTGQATAATTTMRFLVAKASRSPDARAQQRQDQGQGQLQGQGQGINAFNGNTTTVEAPDVKGMGSELAKHAESAGDVRSNSNPATSPCGDSTGLSGQVGVAGGGLATVSETCRAFRIQMLEAVNPEATSTKLAKITHFVGWLPRTLLHVASFGVLN